MAEAAGFPTTCAEWIGYLKECDETEAMQIARGWERDPPGWRLAKLERGEPAADVDALADLCWSLRQKARGLPSAQIIADLRAASTIPPDPIGDQDADEPPGIPPPKWGTGLARLNNRLDGGAYGMTVVSGRPKCGKSLLALACAVEAAIDGWRVLYVNGELTRTEMANRIRRYHPGQLYDLAERMSVHPVETGISPTHVLQKVTERIEIEDDRLLIILDSINRVADMSQGGEASRTYGYLALLRVWQEWLRRAAQISEGRIASIVVSELNVQDITKGRSLEYAADVCIRITPADKREGIFTIDVPHARSSGSGLVGSFVLDWTNGRFEYVGDDIDYDG